jgi:hypothetical protein
MSSYKQSHPDLPWTPHRYSSAEYYANYFMGIQKGPVFRDTPTSPVPPESLHERPHLPIDNKHLSYEENTPRPIMAPPFFDTTSGAASYMSTSSDSSSDMGKKQPFTPTPERDWRFYAAFLSLCVVNFVCALDATIVSVALPVGSRHSGLKRRQKLTL